MKKKKKLLKKKKSPNLKIKKMNKKKKVEIRRVIIKIKWRISKKNLSNQIY